MKSEQLLNELIEAKIITNKLCDRYKAQMIVRHYFCEVFKEAVEKTIIAKNKKQFIYPEFLD
ncbi:hypothetical protein CCP3SC1AL1_570011 [Gammaproteobacteria bacterium]